MNFQKARNKTHHAIIVKQFSIIIEHYYLSMQFILFNPWFAMICVSISFYHPLSILYFRYIYMNTQWGSWQHNCTDIFWSKSAYCIEIIISSFQRLLCRFKSLNSVISSYLRKPVVWGLRSYLQVANNSTSRFIYLDFLGTNAVLKGCQRPRSRS